VLESDTDRQKFIEIYEQYHVQMERTALRILKEQSDAEDAVQNAFMQIIRHFEKTFEIPCEELPFWIISIVKNEARTILRKSSRIVPLEDWDGFTENISDISGYTELVDLFTRLPETYRSVLELKILHGYTDKEIAKRMGISETAVSSRATRGRTLLREIVEKEGFCV
jgi:RNA polymerase sigma factor, sigma-70 family